MNVRRANQLKFLTFVRDRGPLFGVIAVFALSGVVLLSGSYADTPTGSGVASLSLAPADVVVEQGQVINIAMNVDTNGEVAKSIESTIEFAPGALQLQSVQTVCTDPSFQITTKKSTQALGKVTIGCESNMGAVGKHTIATVVFKALSSNSDAPITISNKSNVIRLTDSKSVLGSRTGATIRLESQVKAAVMQPRAVPNYTSKPVCAPKPDRQSCRAQKAYDSNGQELSSPQAVISGYGPKEFHTAYQVPCTPGGPVAAVCATPAAYGPTIAITDAEGYTGGAAGLEKDLAVYNQNYGIAACTIASGCLKVVNQTGGSALPAEVPGSGWAQETILDVISPVGVYHNYLSRGWHRSPGCAGRRGLCPTAPSTGGSRGCRRSCDRSGASRRRARSAPRRVRRPRSIFVAALAPPRSFITRPDSENLRQRA